ncbi:MAG TPA: response regulator transcription factor [Thermoflexales bacterium]|nr:response regulator transcription factor [Thermoflexales bacterium]HQX10991.1 response regulator transcription factor [Thermoflexales bacterium]HQY24957.1 response regulator transcription factor [Thermoflexales bacterium]HQZ53555.1 response regulator transcription factor [Thermoflexales bacterium]HRA53557.1 response regulator transcription factor [Thermoflexales bacterium]
MKNAARKILLIQGGLGESVGLALERSGYPVTWVRTAKSALTHVERDKPVLVIVDLPSLRVDAAKLCQSIKRITETNVLFLGAEGQDAAAAGCDACGDGYIARPLQLRRVMAKVEKLMPAGHAAELRCGELILRPADGMLRKRGEEIRLNPKLSRLLQLFMQHQGEIITRKLLMQQVWETTYMGDTRTLDVHMRWLRERIEDDPTEPRYLKTIRRQGYRFENPKARKQ